MKKYLLSLLMLCCMTVAWAGTGDGSKEHPYTGDWQASELVPKLKEGNHLAYDCVIKCNSGCGLFVYDDKVNNADIIKNWSEWGVGYAITENEPLRVFYKDYYSLNSPEDRKSHTFIVTNVDNSASNRINITGHYSGHYDRGDGTKENPYCGEWQVSELRPKLKKGVYLAFDCVIKDGKITVFDDILKKQVAINWTAWAPGNLIGDPQSGSDYYQYGQDNSAANRRGQSFIVTYVRPIDQDQTELAFIGYFSGFYHTPDADGFYHVYTAKQMETVLNGNAHAKVRLTADIYLSDLGADFDDTFCSTFYGILDGDGHAIKGDHYADNTTERRNRTYLFTYSDGATIKNLTFKHINKSSTAHDNQCIITSQARNNCVFENITLDNVGVSCDNSFVGAVAGVATDCSFTNITVKNSDFTAGNFYPAAVVGSGEHCTFTNIKVENCKINCTYMDGSSGGVVGRANDCNFNNVEVLGTFVKTDGYYIGGVVGFSFRSDYTNCIVDDQSCICADGKFTFNNPIWAEAGGIAGDVTGGSFTNCINSALIAVDGCWAGGIAGYCDDGVVFEDCLNTGMVISIDMDDVTDGFYNKYKTKSGLTCVTKTYKGKEYVIRKHEAVGSYYYLGGIVGAVMSGDCTISKCANLGSVYSSDDDYVGGIAGYLNYATVKDCLSDFHANSDTKGICGAIGDNDGAKASIDNCLNMTTYKDFSAYKNNWEGFSGGNNYSLTTATDAHHITKTTAAKIKSGEICVNLGENWEQNIGTDAYPTPTGNKGLHHTREVSNEYSTICVPFPLASISEGPGRRDYYIFKEVEDVEAGYVDLCFEHADVVPAGTPALFCVYENGEYLFEPAEKEYQFEVQPAVSTDWTFTGTFEKKVFEGDAAKSIYYVSDGEVNNAQTISVEPYHSYFIGPVSSSLITPDGMKTIRIVIPNSGSTPEELMDKLLRIKNVVLCLDTDVDTTGLDLNGDGNVTVADLVIIISMMNNAENTPDTREQTASEDNQLEIYDMETEDDGLRAVSSK